MIRSFLTWLIKAIASPAHDGRIRQGGPMLKPSMRIVVVVLVAAMASLTPITAFAAMLATLTSSHAQPGDSVLLLTDDQRGSWGYEGLSSEDHQPIYVSPTSNNPADACGGPGTEMVGRLQWRGNAGGVAFVVPSLPLGDYWLFMLTSGQCWRLAGATGTGRTASVQILVLSIGSVPADNQDAAKTWTVNALATPTPEPPRSPGALNSTASTFPWFSAAVGGLLALLAVLAVWRIARMRQVVDGC